MPDWFNGEPCPIEWFPPDNEDKQKKLGAFFQKNSPPSVAAKVPEYFKAVSAKYPQIKSWAIIGVSLAFVTSSEVYIEANTNNHSSAGEAKSCRS